MTPNANKIRFCGLILYIYHNLDLRSNSVRNGLEQPNQLD
jgi:hypothetical protein